MKCKDFQRFFRVLPAGSFSAAILKKHIRTCSSCRQIWENDGEFSAWLHVDEEKDAPDILPAVIKGIRSLPGEIWSSPTVSLRRRIVWAIALSLGLLLVLLLLERKGGIIVPNEWGTTTRETFALANTRMNGQPAVPYIYALQKQKMTIVWCEPSQGKSINDQRRKT